jgi:glutathione S-transferase
MKLYFSPRTRATRPRWLLEELEIPFEIIKVDADTKTPLPPFGEVPVLIDGDLTLFESFAMCLHLADRFPEKQLAPPPGSADRGLYYQWIAFAETRLEPVLLDIRAGRDAAVPALNRLLDVVDAALVGREVIVGESFTVADLVMTSILHLGSTLNLLEGHPRLNAYVVRHTSRPAVRRAVA